MEADWKTLVDSFNLTSMESASADAPAERVVQVGQRRGVEAPEVELCQGAARREREAHLSSRLNPLHRERGVLGLQEARIRRIQRGAPDDS